MPERRRKVAFCASLRRRAMDDKDAMPGTPSRLIIDGMVVAVTPRPCLVIEGRRSGSTACSKGTPGCIEADHR